MRTSLRSLLYAAICLGLLALFAPAAQAQDSPPAQGLIYVPVTDEDAVAVLNPATHALITKIPDVGMHPIVLRSLPDRSKVYVDDFGPLQSQVTVISTKTNTVIKKIATLGPAYASMALSADGRYLYVPTALSVVQVIDTRTDTIVHTFPIFIAPVDIELSPDGTTFYAFSITGTVGAYSTMTGAQLKPSISVQGVAPGWADLSADGNTLYSINFITSNVVVIDTRTWKAVKSISLGTGALPLSATLSPDGRQLWVANVGSYDITVIDTSTETVSKVIPTTDAPAYVGFSPDGKSAYLSDLGPVSALPAFLRPAFYDVFYFLPAGQQGYVANYDTNTGARTGQTNVGTGPVAGVYF